MLWMDFLADIGFWTMNLQWKKLIRNYQRWTCLWNISLYSHFDFFRERILGMCLMKKIISSENTWDKNELPSAMLANYSWNLSHENKSALHLRSCKWKHLRKFFLIWISLFETKFIDNVVLSKIKNYFLLKICTLDYKMKAKIRISMFELIRYMKKRLCKKSYLNFVGQCNPFGLLPPVFR